ncbi:MAG: hypothetical protein IPN53_10810 [Comamonadaceae bacterium]|nr:hypothetical protein [Comamonadaceae bacterium]
MAEVVVCVKTNPKKMTFASAGNGSTDHLTAELLWLQTGNFGLQKAVRIHWASRSACRLAVIRC